MVPPRLTVVTLGARDFDRLRAFYLSLGWPLAIDMDGFAAFETLGALLTLYPLDNLAADAKVPRADPQAATGLSLAINVDQAPEVDETIEGARAAGARITAEPSDAEWGGRSAYFLDPEGNLWEVAWVPPDSTMAGLLRGAGGRARTG